MFNIEHLSTPSTKSKPISVDSYNKWQKEYVFDALKGILPGQSFCERFKIQDYRIRFTRDWTLCNHLIQRDWIVPSRQNA